MYLDGYFHLVFVQDPEISLMGVDQLKRSCHQVFVYDQEY